MKRSALTLFTLLISLFTVYAQSINENRLTPTQLMKHYAKFPGSDNISWFQQDDLLQAKFEYNGSKKVITYNESMRMLQEWTEITNVPFEIKIHLDEKYSNYKLNVVYLVNDKVNRTSFYAAIAKVKKVGSVIHSYNEAMGKIENPETMLASLDN